MAYFTEEELEAATGQKFTATSLLKGDTETQVDDLATELSNRFDGLMQQAVGSETPDEYVTQACLGAAVYVVGQIYAGEPIDVEKQDRLLKQFMTPIKKTTLYYSQDYPDSTGDW